MACLETVNKRRVKKKLKNSQAIILSAVFFMDVF